MPIARAPRFVRLPQSAELTVGSRFELECFATGPPSPDIQWLHNGKLLNGTSSFDGYSVLSFDSIKQEHSGIFSCVAKVRFSNLQLLVYNKFLDNCTN